MADKEMTPEEISTRLEEVRQAVLRGEYGPLIKGPGKIKIETTGGLKYTCPDPRVVIERKD
jgi:hypothetical protein